MSSVKISPRGDSARVTVQIPGDTYSMTVRNETRDENWEAGTLALSPFSMVLESRLGAGVDEAALTALGKAIEDTIQAALRKTMADVTIGALRSVGGLEQGALLAPPQSMLRSYAQGEVGEGGQLVSESEIRDLATDLPADILFVKNWISGGGGCLAQLGAAPLLTSLHQLPLYNAVWERVTRVEGRVLAWYDATAAPNPKAGDFKATEGNSIFGGSATAFLGNLPFAWEQVQSGDVWIEPKYVYVIFTRSGDISRDFTANCGPNCVIFQAEEENHMYPFEDHPEKHRILLGRILLSDYVEMDSDADSDGDWVTVTERPRMQMLSSDLLLSAEVFGAMLKADSEEGIGERVDQAIHDVLYASPCKGKVTDGYTEGYVRPYDDSLYPFLCYDEAEGVVGEDHAVFIGEHAVKWDVTYTGSLEPEPTGLKNKVSTLMPHSGLTVTTDFLKVIVHENSFMPETIKFFNNLFMWATAEEAGAPCEVPTYPGLREFSLGTRPFQFGYDGTAEEWLEPKRARKAVARPDFTQIPRNFGRGHSSRKRKGRADLEDLEED